MLRSFRYIFGKDWVVMVSWEDYDKVAQFKWRKLTTGYVARCPKPGGKRKIMLMHRYVLGMPEELVDHINRNRLDNRRENLRLCRDAENACNKGASVRSKSQIKNVCWDPKREKYQVYVEANYKKRAGRTNTLVEAIELRNKWVEELHGEYGTYYTPEGIERPWNRGP